MVARLAFLKSIVMGKNSPGKKIPDSRGGVDVAVERVTIPR